MDALIKMARAMLRKAEVTSEIDKATDSTATGSLTALTAAQITAGAAQLGAQLGLDKVDLTVVVLLEGGTVPASGPELVLALVDSPHCAQPHAVHEPGVPLAELHLKHKLFNVQLITQFRSSNSYWIDQIAVGCFPWDEK